MRGWGFNLFCVLSLFVFLLGMGIWARSYVVPADIEWFSRATDPTSRPPLTRTFCIGFGWGPGTFGIFHYHGKSSIPSATARTWLYREFDRSRTLNSPRTAEDRVNLRLGQFQVLHRISTTEGGWLSVRIAVVPMWLFLAAAIPPLIWWRRRRALRNPAR